MCAVFDLMLDSAVLPYFIFCGFKVKINELTWMQQCCDLDCVSQEAEPLCGDEV